MLTVPPTTTQLHIASTLLLTLSSDPYQQSGHFAKKVWGQVLQRAQRALARSAFGT